LRLYCGQSSGSRRAQGYFQKLLDERRFSDVVTLRKRSNQRFDFGRNPTLNECVCHRGSNRVTKAAAGLSCIPLKMERNRTTRVSVCRYSRTRCLNRELGFLTVN
jgi:hypothetical protein